MPSRGARRNARSPPPVPKRASWLIDRAATGGAERGHAWKRGGWKYPLSPPSPPPASQWRYASLLLDIHPVLLLGLKGGRFYFSGDSS